MEFKLKSKCWVPKGKYIKSLDILKNSSKFRAGNHPKFKRNLAKNRNHELSH